MRLRSLLCTYWTTGESIYSDPCSFFNLITYLFNKDIICFTYFTYKFFVHTHTHLNSRFHQFKNKKIKTCSRACKGSPPHDSLWLVTAEYWSLRLIFDPSSLLPLPTSKIHQNLSLLSFKCIQNSNISPNTLPPPWYVPQAFFTWLVINIVSLYVYCSF